MDPSVDEKASTETPTRHQGFLKSFLKAQYTKLPTPTGDFSGQTIIITGANTGIGLEAARHFTRLNAARVILGCRNLKKGKSAKADIEKTTKRKEVLEVWEVDLNSYKSVKEFCDRAALLDRIDIFVANAGVATPNFEQHEGMEINTQVNVIATFLMIISMLPSLRDNATRHNITPHIVLVTSDGHHQAKFAEKEAPAIFPALNSEENIKDRYSTSKLLEIYVARELAQAMKSDAKPMVILNSPTPGLCNSELTRHYTIPMAGRMLKSTIARSAEMGSRTLIAAAQADSNAHGQYMMNCEIAEPSYHVTDEDGVKLQKKIYDELMTILEGIAPNVTKNI